MPSFAAILSPCTLKKVQLCGNSVTNDSDAHSSHRENSCRREHCNPLFRALIENQWAYAQYLKLMSLFVIALSHVLYMSSFLSAFSALVDYADAIDATATASQSYPLRHQIELLADYRKNMWMTVGSMCVALSTSCFFLLINASAQNVVYVLAMRIVDLVAFSTLPALLLARSMLIESVGEHLPTVLRQMEYIRHPSELIAALGCSVSSTKDMQECSTVILDSLFPMFLIKYLIVLALLTILYIILAYLIEWCIRHFFPPNECHFRSAPPVYAPIIVTG